MVPVTNNQTELPLVTKHHPKSIAGYHWQWKILLKNSTRSQHRSVFFRHDTDSWQSICQIQEIQ